MWTHNGTLRLSASDLSAHLGCHHATELSRLVASGAADAPTVHRPMLEALRERGEEHEAAYVESLKDQGKSVRVIERKGDAGIADTLDALKSGVDVIVQGIFEQDGWHGRSDILLRVEGASALGDFHYEVADTKLAQETRAGAVLQICLYTDLLSQVQERVPECMYIVTPGDELTTHTYRVDAFFAYYRLIKAQLEVAARADGAPSLYPEPVEQCEVCDFWQTCDKRRREDDHLSLVAGITRGQRRELEEQGIATLEAWGRAPVPLSFRPKRGSMDSLVRSREQARIQLEGREGGAPLYEFLPIEEGAGFLRLPEPSQGDVFFDIEGDPFAGPGGLEYLLGIVTLDEGREQFEGLWALKLAEEKATFEAFVDRIMERWALFPDMHVYHYAPYEPSAMKRLMGRHATREAEVDRMLRAGLFVDLYAVVRQGLRASVERYSIKDLEVFYGFERKVELPTASQMLRAMERALELGRPDDISDEVKALVEGYNQDDCESTHHLRNWLERRRAELIAQGHDLPRPEPQDGDQSDAAAERSEELAELMDKLLDGVPIDPTERSAEEEGRFLLAHMQEFHRREAKAAWWEFFRLRELTALDLLDEKQAISGLRFLERVGGTAKCPVDRYRYLAQDTDVRDGDELHLPGEQERSKVGSVDAIDRAARTVDIKKAGVHKETHPEAVFQHSVIGTKPLQEALFRLGEWVADAGIDEDGAHRAARDLLLRKPPRLLPGSKGLAAPEETPLQTAKRLATELSSGVLPIQGPPGAGKTFTGSRMICELVKAGKRVGVTAVSHKVIENLLQGVVKAADEAGQTVRCMRKPGGKADRHASPIREAASSRAALDALTSGEVDVLGGTAWLWTTEAAQHAVDVLFVDEAGQMSLPNVLAVAQAAESVVLLGDPQQLEQPLQGSHPDGTATSALEHVLGDHPTMPADKGLFLGTTFRLHPTLCAMTSELVYEGRLTARSENEHQVLSGTRGFDGAGLHLIPVEHTGNQSSSPEEVEVIADLVACLLEDRATWTDHNQDRHPLRLENILIVVPYNAQVALLRERLPGARIGTVDKFQGQEAPVVIFGMTTSTPEDAPRGMEFLYSQNRFNVATSRAQCACILVASPKLFEPNCRTPRHMELANAFCRYAELATEA